jgi:hypothetical protein
MGDIAHEAFLNYADDHRGGPSYRYVSLLPLTLLTSGGAAIVVAQAWHACDIAFTTRLTVFYLHFPALVVSYTVVLVLADLLTGAAAWPHTVVAVIAALLVVTVTWGYFVFAGLPLQNEFCPDVQPSWWPWLLPPVPGAAP